MKKLVVLMLGVFSLALAIPATAAQTAKKKLTITNTRIVQADKTTTVKYAGVDIVVPGGQTVILGQRSDGSIVVRGRDLSRVQVGDSFVSTRGYSVFSVAPASNVIFLNRGSDLTLTDPTGNSATILAGQAVSVDNATVTSETAPALQAAAAAEAEAAAEVGILPSFVSDTESTESAASEQATQDVTETEETLSPSAPR